MGEGGFSSSICLVPFSTDWRGDLSFHRLRRKERRKRIFLLLCLDFFKLSLILSFHFAKLGRHKWLSWRLFFYVLLSRWWWKEWRNSGWLWWWCSYWRMCVSRCISHVCIWSFIRSPFPLLTRLLRTQNEFWIQVKEPSNYSPCCDIMNPPCVLCMWLCCEWSSTMTSFLLTPSHTLHLTICMCFVCLYITAVMMNYVKREKESEAIEWPHFGCILCCHAVSLVVKVRARRNTRTTSSWWWCEFVLSPSLF